MTVSQSLHSTQTLTLTYDLGDWALLDRDCCGLQRQKVKFKVNQFKG